MSYGRTTPRRSRKERRCEGCRGRIGRGAFYLEHVIAPGHEDVGNVGWWRSPECAECAERYGRPILAGHAAPEDGAR